MDMSSYISINANISDTNEIYLYLKLIKDKNNDNDNLDKYLSILYKKLNPIHSNHFQLDLHDNIVKILQDITPIEPLPPLVLQNLSTKYTLAINQNEIKRRVGILYDKLFPYQIDALNYGIMRNGCCCLYDEMGLGKSFQTLALMNYFSYLISSLSSSSDSISLSSSSSSSNTLSDWKYNNLNWIVICPGAMIMSWYRDLMSYSIYSPHFNNIDDIEDKNDDDKNDDDKHDKHKDDNNKKRKRNSNKNDKGNKKDKKHKKDKKDKKHKHKRDKENDRYIQIVSKSSDILIGRILIMSYTMVPLIMDQLYESIQKEIIMN